MKLHRSIIFWSGLLVMAFIAWAWRDSVFWRSTLYHRSWRLDSSRSGVSAYYTPPPGSFGKARPTRFKATPNSFTHPYLPSPSFVRGAGLPQLPIEVAEDNSTIGSPEYLAWVKEVEAARSEHEQNVIVMRYRPTGEWTLFLPYWILLLAFALPWTGLLVWRARRRKRHMDGVE